MIYDKPTDEQVKNALLHLTKPSLRHAFYAELKNPNWIEPLSRQGAFNDPPETRIEADGTVISEPWFEIDYLVRMAASSSDAVAVVFLKIADSTNQWVRRGIMEAIPAMEPADAAKLVPKVTEWFKPKNPEWNCANFRIDEEKTTDAIVRLLSSDHHEEGIRMADALFMPHATKPAPEFGLSEPHSGFDPYWYSEELPRVAAELGDDRSGKIADWLGRYQKCKSPKTGNGERHLDTSYIWRPSIRNPSGYVDTIGDALVNEAKKALAVSAKKSLGDIESFLKDDRSILRRVGLDALCSLIEEAQCDGQSESLDEGVVKLANTVQSDKSFFRIEYRAEFLPFVRICLRFPQIDSSPFLKSIYEGSGPSYIDRICDLEEREKTKKHWRHQMLARIDRDRNLLPDPTRSMLALLDAEYGRPENLHDEAVFTESFTGPNSSMSLNEMRELNDTQLVDYLKSWHQDPDDVLGPSHEGQGRILSELIAGSPDRIVNAIDEVENLRPTYIRAIIEGWKKATDKGTSIQWGKILKLCDWASNLDASDLPEDVEGLEHDDDRTYKPLHYAVLSLVQAGLLDLKEGRAGNIGEKTQELLFKIICRYAEYPDPTAESEKQFDKNIDSLTISLNTIRPMALRALILLIYSFPNSTVAPSALEIVDQHIGTKDPSHAIAATIGEGAGRIYDSAPYWFEERVGLIFGDDAPITPFQQVSLSTLLATHRPHPKLLKLLIQPMILVLDQSDNPNLLVGWHQGRSLPELVGDWIVLLLVGNAIEKNDRLVEYWFEKSTSTLRGSVLNQLSWKTARYDDTPREMLDHITELWDSRIEYVKEHPEEAEELSGFYWLVQSDKYNADWWLPRLEFVSNAIKGYNSHGLIGERLAIASAKHPDTALRTLCNLIGTDPLTNGSQYDLLEHAAPQVIASALDNGSDETRRKATALMNKLGEMDYLGIRERITKLRS